jgi:hypothetical protein
MTSKAFGLAQLGNAYSDGALSNRNKIINGAMVIDQRNAGAAVTAAGFSVDRFNVINTTDGAFSAQQDSSAPVGFVNSLKFTTTTADATLTTTQQANIQHAIEGTNISDLAWGTADAKAVTLSFWVRSSLTGTFGGALRNSGSSRAYPFTYTISSANTWEYKAVTIPGDTAGTWLTTTGLGIGVAFGLGAGPDRSGTAGAWNSNNNTSATGAVSVIGTLDATFYITGVQLEAGDTATPFEHRSYGQELALCQRYYYRAANGTVNSLGLGVNYTSSYMMGAVYFPVTMRAIPTLNAASGTNYYEFIRDGAADSFNSLTLGTRSTVNIGEIYNDSEISGTVGHGGYIRTDNAAAYVHFDAEI